MRLRCIDASSGQANADDYTDLLKAVRALVDCIDRVRHEALGFDLGDIIARRVPEAADELDAIAVHTESSTCTILQTCEELEKAVHGTATHAVVRSATRRIYEACSFQDLTGQRAAKVIQTLQLVEDRVTGCLQLFGQPLAGGGKSTPAPSLLNGPLHPHEAMNQARVDALLEGAE